MLNTPSKLQTSIKRTPAQVTLDTNPEVRSTTRAALTGFPTDGTIEVLGRISLDTNLLNPWLLILSVLFINQDKEMLSPEKCLSRLLMLTGDLTSPNGSLTILKEKVTKDSITKVGVKCCYTNDSTLCE